MAANPHRRANRAQVAEQQIRCYELRLTGMALAKIAQETGLSEGTVFNRLKAEVDRRVVPLADEVRKVELDRLNIGLVKILAEIDAGRSIARNVEVLVKVSERISKLTGADAPQVVEATVHQVDSTDLALAELVREAQAAAAVKEAVLREGNAQ